MAVLAVRAKTLRAKTWRAIVVATLIAVGSSSPVAAADPDSVGATPKPSPTRADRAKTHRLKIDQALLDIPQALAQGEAVSCGAPAADPVPDGEPIVVSLPPAAPFTVGEISATVWRSPWVTDPTWRLSFESLSWMRPLAQRAADDQQFQSMDVLIRQALAFHLENPDPGTATYGWDEGTAGSRLGTLTCLFSLSHDERLVDAVYACAAVLLGPRYYGPPYRPVHNHGVKANMALIDAARLLGVPAWSDVAIARIEYEAPLVFTAMGTSWEQSSMYQLVNVSLWNRAAAMIGPGPTADAISSYTARGARAYRWMTEPDGKIVQIGDSDKLAGDIAGTGRTGVTYRDDRAGWVIGRWSWSNPSTTYYTVRYGPPRRAHGQQDRGGVTWSTLGVRVLVGPGRFTYDRASAWNAYQQSAVSHNVAIPGGLSLRSTAVVKVTSASIASSAHMWRLSDALYGRAHYRTVTVNNATHALRVADSFSGTGVFRQAWHLDPAWILRSRNAAGTWLRFTNGLGRTLTVTTTGLFSSCLRGQTSPVIAGWNFPAFRSRVPAYQLTLRAYTPMTTTFVVT
jgi:heparinase II/III-like protein